ncbi:ABC transporter permease [Streptosporangium sp. NPDC000239]|uniref:ABC transporter permease n=1 Tax=Streptosporangium jomthongense TaxID=1193683 RepID=A0ABV8FF35_9ACTN
MNTWVRELAQAIGGEWVKLRSVRSTWWCLACTTALMVLGSLAIGGGTATEMVRRDLAGTLSASDPVTSATAFAQFGLVALAMLTITPEYASGGIRTTLQATPIRGRVLAAKALVLAPVTFVAGVVAAGVATAVVHLVLSAEVFGGRVTAPPAEVVPDLLGVGVFLALVSVTTLGVGVATRSAAGTLTTAFMLLMGAPLLLVMTGTSIGFEASLRMPLFAGLAFMGSSDTPMGGPVPYPATQGLVWLLVWTAAATVAGYAVLRRRDA